MSTVFYPISKIISRQWFLNGTYGYMYKWKTHSPAENYDLKEGIWLAPQERPSLLLGKLLQEF